MPFRLSPRTPSRGPVTLAFALVALAATACQCGDTVVEVPGGLVVSPTSIDFGDTPIGTVKSVVVQVQNVGRGSINVSSIALQTAISDVAVTDLLVSDCQNKPRSDSSLMTILGGECATFEVRYGPNAQVKLTDAVLVKSNDQKQPVITIPLTGEGVTGTIRACFVTGSGSSATVDTSTCIPEVSPGPTLAFGTYSFGQKATRTVRVFNDGQYALAVSDAIIKSTFSDFSLVGAPVSAVIQPMQSTDLVVQFDPQLDGPETASLIIPSSDVTHPTLTIPITATALGPKLCITPNPVAFGTIPTGTTRTLTLTLSNCGQADYSITTLELINNGTATVFTTPAAGATGAIPTLPVDFPTGATMVVDVTYAPIHETADSAYFSIKTTYQHATVPVTGTGGFPGCSATGTNLTPTANIVVSQSGTVVDPMTVTFDPLSSASLDGSTSVAPSPTTISGYTWRIVSQPAGSTASLSSTTSAKVSIFMELVGDYVIGLVVSTTPSTGVMCQSPETTVTLHVISRAAVHVQLTWPQAYGDMDLHYIGPGGTFYDMQGDLYWIDSLATAYGPGIPTANPGAKGPDWGLNNTVQPDGTTADDASLDVDQRWGSGPENATHNKPFDGTYQIDVHYYCSSNELNPFAGSSGPATPIIKVYVQGTLAWTGTGPSMIDNQLWSPAQVVVANNGADITVVPAANQTALTMVTQGCGG